MSHTKEELDAAAARRAETSDHIVHSMVDKRLIIAGPGTGKTYNFRRALEAVGGGGLALTFIRALVRDLDRDLGDLAQVNTFHGYCKHLAHKLPLDGMIGGIDYYPPLVVLMADDLRLMGHVDVGDGDLERALHQLDDGDGLITRVLGLGAYYNAVSHADVVYRVLAHLEENPASVPTFPLVVVDEYQDFCLMETRFIEVLGTKSPVLVAGDDDQALYAFKSASPEFIRALAENPAYERFDLPYCSRCTEVVVDAVNNVVEEAQLRGNLEGRVDREYLCYLPDKLADSEAHPAIIHAKCSVHTKKAPYLGMYVAEQIGAISPEDIAESHAGKYPTALVIGRRHYVEAAYEAIRQTYPNAVLRTSVALVVDPLDGYRRLARDGRSRLGWRIILHALPPSRGGDLVAEALRDHSDLVDRLPDEYRTHHLETSATIGRDEEGEESPALEPDEAVPTIVCTSLLGAKGMSAGSVFIVGFNNGAFPSDPSAVSDDEVCKLIVGLSRTRKECHLVSCGMFGGPPWKNPSTFLDWLGVPIAKVAVSKGYWK